ncbi:MAG: c-type cytochrome domain-containing protein, partial [Planctomycetia bacterium]
MTSAEKRSLRVLVFVATAGCMSPVAGQAVSFSKQVAPILAAKCGGCHIAGRKGGFQMASYAGLMQSGMVQRGAANASRLVEVILSGDMPRGGGKVAPDEVGTLMKWIDGGAAYDGKDPAIPLDQLLRAATAPPPPPPPAAPVALKPGEVSFAIDVAPVLLKECAGCHGQREPEANLRMTSLESLLRGGRSGPPMQPGKGAASLLVRKLR